MYNFRRVERTGAMLERRERQEFSCSHDGTAGSGLTLSHVAMINSRLHMKAA
jgi:hypothetical protein